MNIITKKLTYNTKGNLDLIDITHDISEALANESMSEGNMTVFVIGSTGAITTFEYEPGLIRDMNDLYEKLAPVKRHYNHDETWGDANGFSHVRAALQGSSITIPFEKGSLILGTWQQVVLAEFDNQPRKRQVVVQMIGK